MYLEVIDKLLNEKIFKFKDIFKELSPERHYAERFTKDWLEPFETYLKIRVSQSNRKFSCETDDEIKKLIRDFDDEYIGDFDHKYDFVRSELLFRSTYCSKDVFDFFMEFIDYDKVMKKLGFIFVDGYGYDIQTCN